MLFRSEFAPASIGELIDGALDAFRPVLEQQAFTIDIDIERGLPPIAEDGAAVIQAIENLIDNAIKYSADNKALRITARQHGDTVAITIADRGIGIPAAEQSRVFERFYRGRNNRATGSGLGLTLASRIVEHHHGQIRIASKEGEGTEVTLTFPAGAAA